MKRKYLILFVFFISIVLFLITCSGLLSNPEDAPKSVSWIHIKTGLTDSFTIDDTCITKFLVDDYDEYARVVGDILDSGGFDISWNSTLNADYYEIRISKKRITEDNWNKATLISTVQARPGSRMFTSIKALKPSIKGNNCTGCEYCVFACPNNAITMFRNKAVIDLSLCTSCGICYDTCNYNAITNCFLGESYYFAVRSFSKSGEGANNVMGTLDSYKLRYVSWHWKENEDKSKTQVCGACGKGCYILNNKAQEKGCPVNAILFDSTGEIYDKGMVYIDQSKCIYCGNCLRKCIYSHLPNNYTREGRFAIRREVLSSKDQDKKVKREERREKR